MIISNNSIDPASEALCNFIIDKLGINQSALELGMRRCSLENSPLPIVMYTYGLITISQLKIILLWLKDN